MLPLLLAHSLHPLCLTLLRKIFLLSSRFHYHLSSLLSLTLGCRSSFHFHPSLPMIHVDMSHWRSFSPQVLLKF
ncbi:hypothetical protein E1A91_A08G116700v1 [Gossypium mustelinum]|uniref:Uncharacterized protein n=1 Tax=Gossypium mustelinum TaxID=34275 RepID=A0A5D2Y8K9_GOSMU|nr:hypothetical protein E1A91_A08G116700v1 [Gossypium mustelinum]